MKRLIAAFTQHEQVNFLLTNRIPRKFFTHLMGWFSRIENPLVCRLSIAAWRLFADLDLSDARATRFASMHACFTRELMAGARAIDMDPAVLVSPCDAIVGACGQVEDGMLIQAKGFPYRLQDLLHDADLVREHGNGTYVTLRLTSAMYHRFHAPHDLSVAEVNYISGDTWNVNPIALKRIERLYCRNERAVIRTCLPDGAALTLVAVAAVLVASIRLNFVDVLLNLRYRGPNRISCAASFAKGAEMGRFEHGSTIIVFAPPGVQLIASVQPGTRIRMGAALLRLG